MEVEGEVVVAAGQMGRVTTGMPMEDEGLAVEVADQGVGP